MLKYLQSGGGDATATAGATGQSGKDPLQGGTVS